MIDWNLTWNFVLAVVAVAGFISSLVISIYTLRQSNKLFKKQSDISLFEKRYEVLTDAMEFLINENYLKEEYHAKVGNVRLKLLFIFDKDVAKDLLKLCDDLFALYNHKVPLPDYISRYKDRLVNDGLEVNQHNALMVHGLECLKKLKEQLTI
jgi:hypothetical protein